MNKKIVITGATGLIGRKIAKRLIERGDEVIIFSRSIEKAMRSVPNAARYVHWDINSEEWKQNLNGIDVVINLSGENLMAKRWSSEQKKKIRDSRILSTKALVTTINELPDKPKVFVSASAVGFYGNPETEVDETFPPGKGFLAEVVKDWEKESEPLNKIGVRRVIVRIGIVLDKDGGALEKMVLPFKLFIGGPLGSGNQWMSWIHIEDLVKLFLFAIDNEDVEGVVNCVSPNPVNMKEFAKTIGITLKRPSIFKVPPFVLKMILGEASKTVLEGVKVSPAKVLNFGYEFGYKNIQEAIEDLLR